MLHPSRILALYSIFFLIVVGFLTASSWAIPDYSFLLMPLIMVTFFFWRLKILRYVGLAIIIMIFGFISVKNAIPERIEGLYDEKAIIFTEPKIIGKSQKFKIKDQKDRVLEVVTGQFPEYEFGEGVVVSGQTNNDVQTSANEKLSGTLVFPKIKRGEAIQISELEKARYILQRSLIGLKKKYEEKISASISEPEAGLFAGILLGSRNDLSQELFSILSRTGTIHIVALSGFNITILAEFMRLLTRNFSKRTAAIIPLITIWSFVFATGLSASVVRAAIMGSLVILAHFLGRRSDSLTSVLLASSLMVALNPYILLYDIGFQLSFAATAGILFLAPLIEKCFATIGQFLGPILATTISAQVFTWPITSYYFGTVSLIAPLANLFILPFIPILMLIGFVGVTVSFVSFWLGSKIMLISWVILGYFIKAISVFAKPDFAAMNINLSSLLVILGYYLLLLDVVLILKKVRKVERTTI